MSKTISNKQRTKAEMLSYLKPDITFSYILPMVKFTLREWSEDKLSIIKLASQFKDNQLVVRSSAQGEDKQGNSCAGQYLSLLAVKNCASDIEKAITDVFLSYQSTDAEHQVLIQPLLKNVLLSGVIFTQEPNTSSPYYILSYDDTSHRTDTVTSGENNEIKVEYISQLFQKEDSWQAKLITATNEIQLLVDKSHLDIEFAIDSTGAICIFQVRHLHISDENYSPSDLYKLELNCIQNKIDRLAQPHPYLRGEKSIFGVMPDWNPAEVIGVKPRPLALSLYKELITDDVWSHQRTNYHYRNVKDFPLMIVLGGTPYIDVRLSFNSFIPRTLNDDIAEKLVNYYIEKLAANPQLHDKIEFSIVYSCFTFDLESQLTSLLASGFDDGEVLDIQAALLTLTKDLIEDDKSVWRQDIAKITQLQNKQKEVQLSHLNSVEKIYWILTDCRNFGTLPFAGLARVGFIAMQMLSSLLNVSVFTQVRYQQFLNSIETVSSQLMHDFYHLDKSTFLSLYGHLRPGTYDILSKRYDEQPDFYFDWSKKDNKANKVQGENFVLSVDEKNKIDILLQKYGFTIDAQALLHFIRTAIEQRELGKFVFTKSLSDCFQWIEKLGNKLGFSRDDVSYIDIKDLLKLYANSYSAQATIASSITLGKSQHELSQKIHLPSIILDKKQTYNFILMHEQPNFITLNTVSGHVAMLSNAKQQDFEGCIAFIESADPGYDWIFSKGIVAFVTKYGGCNSHMAIRASELNMPAIIGCGDTLFKRWSKTNVLTIDCSNKKVDMK